MALYKKISDTDLRSAEHEVNCPDGRVIVVADHVDESGEIHDGWHWFNTRDEAKEALGVTDPEPIKPE